MGVARLHVRCHGNHRQQEVVHAHRKGAQALERRKPDCIIPQIFFSKIPKLTEIYKEEQEEAQKKRTKREKTLKDEKIRGRKEMTKNA